MDRTISRRKMLATCSMTGLAVVSPGLAAAAKKPAYAEDTRRTFLYADTAAMKEDRQLKNGDMACTAGFYHAGDGGDATYLIQSDSTLMADGGACLPLDTGLFATLINVSVINYRMFGAIGDGKSDDGAQIKAAHAYANRIRVPVVNLHGEYRTGTTRGIVIQTDVSWGTTRIYIDEKNNKRTPIFLVTGRNRPIQVKLTETEKQAFLSQFKPGVRVITELAPYKNCLLVVSDNKDRIGFRSGAAYAGRVSRAREELFCVEEHGRIIGDIAWEFRDYTSFTAYPLDENYLTIEGGSFHVSGDGSAGTTSYVMNGFQISRSRTIIRNQWVGLEAGKGDTSLAPRSGFYSFSTVYDCLLENVRLIPWEKDRGSKAISVPQGTYGLGGNRMLGVVFRNVTAEGSPIHWGVFGTNMNKDFRIERCKLNRVDVHFHCWNLHIADSAIGVKGISITGGGNLTVENTSCGSHRFINFRQDYGGKWDGDIYIKNCRLVPDQAIPLSILSFLSSNFNYHYPIGYGRRIKVEDVVVDYTALRDKTVPCWLMRTSSYRPSPERPLFFPDFAEFRNITVVGGGTGIRLMQLSDMSGFKLNNGGLYNDVELTPNAQLLFENIQLEKPASPDKGQDMHMVFHPPGRRAGGGLLPRIVFRNCCHFRGHFGGNAMILLFENCTIHELHGSDRGRLPGSLYFSNCTFRPVVAVESKPFSLATVQGTTFTNCLLLAPEISGQIRPELLHLIDFVQLNNAVKYNHLNTRLGNDILNYCQKERIRLLPAFISMLKSHHELEEEYIG